MEIKPDIMDILTFYKQELARVQEENIVLKASNKKLRENVTTLESQLPKEPVEEEGDGNAI